MRIEQLTFTRFIAAVLVVIFHYGKNVFPFNTHFLAPFFTQANVFVSYFFILSGFVMVVAYSGNKSSQLDLFEFYKKRFARIYPLYFLALLLFIITTALPIGKMALGLHVLSIQAWVPSFALTLNYPGWSIAVEFFFYLVFPFLFNYLYIRKNIAFNLSIAILIWVATQIVFHSLLLYANTSSNSSVWYRFLFYFPVLHLNEFLLGNVLGLIYCKKLSTKKYSLDILIITLCFLLFVLIKYDFSYLNFHNGLLAIIFIPLILCLSLNKGVISSLFSQKKFIMLGDISFGIYILQVPVFTFSYLILNKLQIVNQELVFYISLLALIIVSLSSYKYFEVPFRRLISKIKLDRSKAVYQ